LARVFDQLRGQRAGFVAGKETSAHSANYGLRNPDFSGKGLIASNTSSTPLLAMRSLDQRDLQSLFLIPLPGTSNECVALAAQAKRWDWPAQVYLGLEATEAQLQAVPISAHPAFSHARGSFCRRRM